MVVSKSKMDGLEIITVENGYIRCEMAPEAGGKIISIYNKRLQNCSKGKQSNSHPHHIQPQSATGGKANARRVFFTHFTKRK
jgi:hypothetical protein